MFSSIKSGAISSLLRFSLAFGLLLLFLSFGQTTPRRHSERELEVPPPSPQVPRHRQFDGIRLVHYDFQNQELKWELRAQKAYPLSMKEKVGPPHAEELVISEPRIRLFSLREKGEFTFSKPYRFRSQKGKVLWNKKGKSRVTLEGEVRLWLPRGEVIETDEFVLEMEKKGKKTIATGFTTGPVKWSSDSPYLRLTASRFAFALENHYYQFFGPVKMTAERDFFSQKNSSLPGFFSLKSSGKIEIWRRGKGQFRLRGKKGGLFQYHPDYRRKPPLFPIEFSSHYFQIEGRRGKGRTGPENLLYFQGKGKVIFREKRRDFLLRAHRVRWFPEEQRMRFWGREKVQIQYGRHRLSCRWGDYWWNNSLVHLRGDIRSRFFYSSPRGKEKAFPQWWNLICDEVKARFSPRRKLWWLEGRSKEGPLTLFDRREKWVIHCRRFQYHRRDQRVDFFSSKGEVVHLFWEGNRLRCQKVSLLLEERRALFEGRVQGEFHQVPSAFDKDSFSQISPSLKDKKNWKKDLPLFWWASTMEVTLTEDRKLLTFLLGGGFRLQTPGNSLWGKELVYESPGEVLTLTGEGLQSAWGKNFLVKAREIVYLGRSRQILLKEEVVGFFRSQTGSERWRDQEIYFTGDKGEIYLDKRSKIHFLKGKGEPLVQFWGRDFTGECRQFFWNEKEEELRMEEKVKVTSANFQIQGRSFTYGAKKGHFQLRGQTRVKGILPSPQGQRLEKSPLAEMVRKARGEFHPMAPWILTAEGIRGKIRGRDFKDRSQFDFTAYSTEEVRVSNVRNGLVMKGKTLKWLGKKGKLKLRGDKKGDPRIEWETSPGQQSILARKIDLDLDGHRLDFSGQVRGNLHSKNWDPLKDKTEDESNRARWQYRLNKLTVFFPPEKKEGKRKVKVLGKGPLFLSRPGFSVRADSLLWLVQEEKVLLKGQPFAQIRRKTFVLRDPLIYYYPRRKNIQTQGGGRWLNQPEEK